MKKTLYVVLLIAMLSTFGSRAANMPPATNLQAVQISADPNANQNNATTFDLVFVYDTWALSNMPKNSPDWFQKKGALIAGLARSINVVSLQITPGRRVNLPEDMRFPPDHRKAIGVFGYANYFSPRGQAAFTLTPFEAVNILLNPDTIRIEPSSPGRRN